MLPKLPAAVAFSLSLALPALAFAQGEANVDLPRHPAISPDGQTVVFSWHGDLWQVPADGGDARRLTGDPADELYARFSPDGRRIAFTSDRRGVTGLYAMNSDGTGVEEVLVLPRASLVTDFTDDGELLFTGFVEPDVYRSPRPYTVDARGGVHERIFDAFGRSPVKEPSGDRVLFVRGDSGWDRRHARGPDTRDVWLWDGGDGFTQLTDWAGNDGMPKWVAGGKFVYASDRNERTVNLYLAEAADGENAGENARRLTFYTDRDVEGFDVTPDGKTLVFHRWDALYSLDLTDEKGEPGRLEVRAAADDSTNVDYVDTAGEADEAVISPDGKTVAVVAHGQVYVRAADERAATRRVSESMARHKHVAWSPDGGTLYFVNDETGRDAVYAATVALTRGDVKEQAEKLEEQVKAAATQPATEPATRPDEEAEEAAGGPDPAKWPDALAFNIEVVSQSDRGDADPVPSPDGTKLALHRGVGDLVVLDLVTGDETVILDGWSNGLGYSWSPDSTHLLYETDDADFNVDVWAAAADGTGERVNLTRHPDNDGQISLSADGRMMAFISERVNEEYDVWMVYLDEELETITPQELAEYHDELAKAVKKQKPIDVPAFATARGSVSPLVKSSATGQFAARMTAAAKRAAELVGEVLFADEEEGGEEKAELEVADFGSLALDTAYLRLRRVSREPGGEFNALLLPDGSAVYYTSGGRLVKKPWDEEAKPAGSAVSVANVTADGSTFAYVARGRPGVQNAANDKRETYPAEDRLEIDLAEQNERKFRELARTLGDQFYHPTMKGLDWPALTDEYAPLARAARTGDEFEHVANKLLGELNASHLGVYAPGTARPARQDFGRLGVRTVPAENGFEVVEVLETGPVGRGPMKVEVGDVITRLALEPVDLRRPLEVQLADKVGREVVVTIERGGGELNLLATPASYGQISAETYNSWRLDNLRKVEEMSGGRLGYIHVRGMDQGSLDVFERDLYAAAEGKDGLVIDVRNNGGGWTTDRLLASIMYPRHAYTIPRGMRESRDENRANLARGGYPQDRLVHPAVHAAGEHAVQRELVLERRDHQPRLQAARPRHAGRRGDGRRRDLDGQLHARRRHPRPPAVPRLVPDGRPRHGEQRGRPRPPRPADAAK